MPSPDYKSLLRSTVQDDWQQSWECAETLSSFWQCCVKLPKLGVSDAPGLGLSARLMEGTTLDCLLNDRCQQRPTSSKLQVGDVCWLTAEKDDDTEISQSANTDTHGTYAPFCALVQLWSAQLIKKRQQGRAAILKPKPMLSVPFLCWWGDLWSHLTLKGLQWPLIRGLDYSLTFITTTLLG